MRGTLRKALVVLAILSLVSSTASATVKHLKIIHWNDLHAQLEPMTIRSGDSTRRVGGFAYLETIVDSLRDVAEAHQTACIALDGGDSFQGTLVSSITKGKAIYEALNELQPDAAAIGNHEFDYGWKNLDEQMHTTARFPIVCANLLNAYGTDFTQHYTIATKNGLRIAIVGLTTELLAQNTLPDNVRGVTVQPYTTILRRVLVEVHRHAPDLVVLLTHIGVESDSMIASQYPGIDVIVGGHSHTPLFKPMKVGKTIIVQAGSRGRWVGELDLDVDDVGDSVVSSRGKLIEIETDRINPEVKAVATVARLLAEVDSSYYVQIGTLESDWKASPKYNGNLSTFEASAFRTKYAADIACINLGGLRKSLTAGAILLKDIYEINPFSNALVRLTLRGRFVRSAVEHMLSTSEADACEFSGIHCEFDRAKNKLTSISVGGTALDDGAPYTLVTNEFVASKLLGIFGLHSADYILQHLDGTDAEAIADFVRSVRTIDGKPQPWVSFAH